MHERVRYVGCVDRLCTGFGVGGGTARMDGFALLVMGFPGAAECCNYIAAYLKDSLLSSP
jgi:hypothetical protein